MNGSSESLKLTNQQQRVLKLLFKFRFVSAKLLAAVMGIRSDSAYEVLEKLVSKDLVTKVYESSFRIDRKPAYYYLNKAGVTTVRKVMDAKEPVVHALYKNDEMTDDFIQHCMKLMHCYTVITKHLPEGSAIFSKAEISRFSQFPKTRPDLYIRTSDGKEAIIILADDKPLYIVRKRLDEILTHSEEDGWDDDYPVIAFILKDHAAKSSFLYTTQKKLEGIGIEDELTVLASYGGILKDENSKPWAHAFEPKSFRALLE